jgi:hypothetical protein
MPSGSIFAAQEGNWDDMAGQKGTEVPTEMAYMGPIVLGSLQCNIVRVLWVAANAF